MRILILWVINYKKIFMFLDIAIGIFTGIIINFFSNGHTNSFITYSIFFALLPDLDFVIYKIFDLSPDKGYKHRDLFHNPLIYLPLGCLLIFIINGNKFIILSFIIISLLHFIHDSIAYGRGIKWLYPFSNNSYAFFYLYSKVIKRGLWKLLFIFNSESIPKFDKEHGDENWIKNIYLKWHPIAIIEFSFFIISLIALYFYV